MFTQKDRESSYVRMWRSPHPHSWLSGYMYAMIDAGMLDSSEYEEAQFLMQVLTLKMVP